MICKGTGSESLHSVVSFRKQILHIRDPQGALNGFDFGPHSLIVSRKALSA
jgi:hypothetical protein